MIVEFGKYGVAYCGDCLKILPTLEKVDLVLTDPPYGIQYDKAAHSASGSKGKAAKKGIYKKTDWDYKPEKKVFDMLIEKSNNQIIFGAEHLCLMLPQSKGWIVWDKHTEGNFSDCELAWTNLSKAVKKYDWTWNGMIQQQMGERKEERFHPTQKPIGLMQLILQDYSEKGQTILDAFAGSGTTAIACIKEDRRFIIIEKDPEYFDICVQRIKEAIIERESMLF